MEAQFLPDINGKGSHEGEAKGRARKTLQGCSSRRIGLCSFKSQSAQRVHNFYTFFLAAELGDYSPSRHSPGYVSEFRFHSAQTEEVEQAVEVAHGRLVGLVPSQAENRYLEKVKWLDMYGVDLHPVIGEDNIEYFLGLTPSGIIVLKNRNKVFETFA